jgi:hypothetical protein
MTYHGKGRCPFTELPEMRAVAEEGLEPPGTDPAAGDGLEVPGPATPAEDGLEPAGTDAAAGVGLGPACAGAPIACATSR